MPEEQCLEGGRWVSSPFGYGAMKVQCQLRSSKRVRKQSFALARTPDIKRKIFSPNQKPLPFSPTLNKPKKIKTFTITLFALFKTLCKPLSVLKYLLPLQAKPKKKISMGAAKTYYNHFQEHHHFTDSSTSMTENPRKPLQIIFKIPNFTNYFFFLSLYFTILIP